MAVSDCRAYAQRLAAVSTVILLAGCGYAPASFLKRMQAGAAARHDHVATPSQGQHTPERDRSGAGALFGKPQDGDPGCAGSPDQMSSLTMGAAIARAACSNPRLTDAMLSVRAEVAQKGLALSQFLPSVVGSSQRARNYTRSDSLFGPSTTLITGNSHSVAMNWLLTDFGGRLALYRAADKTAFASMANEDLVLQETIAAVTEAYLNALTIADLKEAGEKALKTARDTLKVAKSKTAGGVATPVDVEFAELNVQQQLLGQRNVEGQLASAMGDLAVLMNLPPDTVIRLAPAADRPTPSDSIPAEKLAALMTQLESHPEIQAAKARAEAAEQQIVAARSDLLPKVSATGSYYRDGRPGSSVAAKGTKEGFLGITVSVPITAPLTEYNRVRLARTQYRRSLAQVEDTRKRVQGAFWRAFQSAQTAARVAGHAKLAERHASNAAAKANIRYRNGASDFTELLRAQKALNDGRVDLIRANSDMRVTRVRLLLSLGRLGPWRLGGPGAEADANGQEIARRSRAAATGLEPRRPGALRQTAQTARSPSE